MTGSPARPVPLRRGRAGGLLPALALLLLLLPGVAGAAGPAVEVSPTSGGPGTPVTVTGTGFCGRAACGPVRLSMSGRQLAADQRPDAAGRFRAATRALGGLTPGEHEVVATQVLDDGNEISATASFVYSPSKGEEAEREAENRDAVNALGDPSAPTASPRGVPFASLAAEPSEAPAPAAAASGAPAEPAGSVTAVSTDVAGWLVPAAVAGAAAAVLFVTGVVSRRRRPARHALGGDS